MIPDGVGCTRAMPAGGAKVVEMQLTSTRFQRASR